MTKKDYKKLGEECFNHLEEINPNGGLKEFIRIAVEFGYKRAVKNNVALASVNNRSKTKKVSSDGVFFRCDNCGFEPQMKSCTDDLLQMHYCPKCGVEFE